MNPITPEKPRASWSERLEVAICLAALAFILAFAFGVAGGCAETGPDCGEGTVEFDGDCIPTGCPAGTVRDLDNDSTAICCAPSGDVPADVFAPCPDGRSLQAGCCVVDPPFGYKARGFARDPQGADARWIDHALIVAWDNQPISVTQGTDAGTYLFTGPDLDEAVETFSVDALQWCFGRYEGPLTIQQGQTSLIGFDRNGNPCTSDYRPRCEYAFLPAFRDLATAYGLPWDGARALGACCEAYGEGQNVCGICPDFDITPCTGPVIFENGVCGCFAPDPQGGEVVPNDDDDDDGGGEVLGPMAECLSSKSPAICCAELYLAASNPPCPEEYRAYCDAVFDQGGFPNDCIEVE